MNKLLKKFIEFGFGNVITLILGFISSPIITRIVKPEEYGKFSMFNTITNLFLVVFMVGLDQAYARYFYEEKEKNRGILLRETIKIPLIVNFAFSIIMLLFYKEISKFTVGSYSLSLVVMIIIQNTFGILSRFLSLLIRMEQKGKTFSVIQIINKIAYIAFTLMLFNIFNRDYRTLVFAITISTIISTIVAGIIEKDKLFYKGDKIKLKTTKKEMVIFGYPLIFSAAITWVFQSVDRVFINYFNGYNELGIYSSAFSIVSLLNAVQTTFATFWVPVANERYLQNNEESKSFFVRINSLVAFFMLLIGILLITFKEVIILLLGPDYRGASSIFPFLVFMPIMYTISETTVLGINFKKKTKYHIYIAGICAIINIIGNFALVPVIGAKGAAISTGLSYIIFFIARTHISQRFYKVNYKLKKLYINLLILLAIAILASFYKTNIYIVILGIINIIFLVISYKNDILDIFNLLNFKSKNK